MTLSTSTRLDVVNKIFRAVGERLHPTTSTTGLKALDCIRDALTDIELANDWLFLRVRKNADSWNDHVATLLNYRRLFSVEAKRSVNAGFTTLHYVEPDAFSSMVLTAYADLGWQASYYTVLNDTDIGVNPYPVTVGDRANLFFNVQDALIMPATDNDFFNMPENCITMLTQLASAYMSQRHLNELNTMQSFLGLYQSTLQQMRSFYRGRPSSQANMFRYYGNSRDKL